MNEEEILKKLIELTDWAKSEQNAHYDEYREKIKRLTDWAKAEQQARYAAEAKLAQARSDLLYLENDADTVITAWEKGLSHGAIDMAIVQLKKRVERD